MTKSPVGRLPRDRDQLYTQWSLIEYGSALAFYPLNSESPRTLALCASFGTVQITSVQLLLAGFMQLKILAGFTSNNVENVSSASTLLVGQTGVRRRYHFSIHGLTHSNCGKDNDWSN